MTEHINSNSATQSSRLHTPPNPNALLRSDHEHLTGLSVLLNRPGQLLLCTAIFLGVVIFVQERVLKEDAGGDLGALSASSVPVAPAVLSARVNHALERSGIESEGPSGGPGAPDAEGRGLVGLWNKVTQEPAPEPPASAPSPAPEPGEPAPAGDDVQPIEDPTNTAMLPFYRSLKRTEDKAPGAVTRVIHFGDSTIVADLITGTARRKLQERFGDAGHGFVLIGKPWDWYIHQNIRHDAADTWKLNRVTFNPVKDNHHGLGGVNARANGAGPWATFGTMDSGTTGRNLSRLVVLYHGQPTGGKLSIELDGTPKDTLDTRADKAADLTHTVTFDDGPHKLRLRAEGDGEVRLYGVALERDTPGVIYDSVGISGIRARVMGRYNAEHFKSQLKARDPDLIILNMGTNESEFEGMNMNEYEQDLRALVKRVRTSVPDAACLVAAPPDRAAKNDAGRLVTTPLIPRIVEVQKRVSIEEGCAFWNTWEAMGGENSMVAWFRHKPRLGSGDYTHFTAAGGEAMGLLLYDALMDGYARSSK